MSYEPKAFPCEIELGLTKREYFAAMAMQGLLITFAADLRDGNLTGYQIAERAASMAQALINVMQEDQS